MIPRFVGSLLFGLALTLGGCVIYGHDRGYYHSPHFRYQYWGPPIQFRFQYYRGWHGLNRQDNALHPAFQVEYEDAPFMCIDPEYGETSEG